MPGGGGRHILVEISAGELIDKITILRIKARRIGEAAEAGRVRAELAGLLAARDALFAAAPAPVEFGPLARELRAVNQTLWPIEDELRRCERAGDFGPRFVELARAVYQANDRRHAIKRRIDVCLGSSVVEEKEYAACAPPRPRA